MKYILKKLHIIRFYECNFKTKRFLICIIAIKPKKADEVKKTRWAKSKYIYIYYLRWFHTIHVSNGSILYHYVYFNNDISCITMDIFQLSDAFDFSYYHSNNILLKNMYFFNVFCKICIFPICKNTAYISSSIFYFLMRKVLFWIKIAQEISLI